MFCLTAGIFLDTNISDRRESATFPAILLNKRTIVYRDTKLFVQSSVQDLLNCLVNHVNCECFCRRSTVRYATVYWKSNFLFYNSN